MTDKPILFSGPMVRALMDGRKTQTRRVIKDRGDLPQFCGGRYDDKNDISCWGWEDCDRGEWVTLDQWRYWRFIPYAIGGRLWVREACRLTDDGDSECVVYEADEQAVQSHVRDVRRIQTQLGLSDAWAAPHLRKRPPIHMPRWASRLTLVVTDVRVQRLQEISADDARAEGVQPVHDPASDTGEPAYLNYQDTGEAFAGLGAARISFMTLWDSLNAKRGYGWDVNPWVAAYTFDVHRQNIDQMGDAA